MRNAATEWLPIEEILSPASPAEISDLLRRPGTVGDAIYPIGGATSLDFGLVPSKPGIGLSTAQLDRVIDYPARDMTITVESGITMASLAEILAAEGQCLPIDVPRPEVATLGGVMATNFSGPRRYGHGTFRDFVIGVHAIDGTGRPFKAGGRVVKNVAGYDFCKLLTGSMGTLAVVFQMTLKLKPLPRCTQLVACRIESQQATEALLQQVNESATTPVSVELLRGPVWQADPITGPLLTESQDGLLVVGFEGTGKEVDWMVAQWCRELESLPAVAVTTLADESGHQLVHTMSGFPDAVERDRAELVLKATMLPSAVASFCQTAMAVDDQISLQAHAGDGVVMLSFARFPPQGLTTTLVSQLAPLAMAAHGNIITLSNPGRQEMTPRSVWGGVAVPFSLMAEVKQKFDPQNRLNPGRFVYPG